MEPLLLYTSWPESESAKACARALLEERLIACANLFPPGVSLYRYEGALHEEPEHVMILKLTRRTVQKVIDKLRAAHPYTCPCVLVLPVEGGSSPFLQWIVRETS